MMRFAAVALLPAVVLAQVEATVTLCKTGDTACTPPSGADMTVPAGVVGIFMVDIATPACARAVQKFAHVGH